MDRMSLMAPPAVFMSITMAAAFWFLAVDTTRDMKADAPGFTGMLLLKSAITTTFPLPDASGLIDVSAEETKKLPAATKSSAAQSKPTTIGKRKTFFGFN